MYCRDKQATLDDDQDQRQHVFDEQVFQVSDRAPKSTGTHAVAPTAAPIAAPVAAAHDNKRCRFREPSVFARDTIQRNSRARLPRHEVADGAQARRSIGAVAVAQSRFRRVDRFRQAVEGLRCE